MHDIADFESRGIPGVFVSSNEFTEATLTQAAALGCDPMAVYVPHPIQDRTDEEMRAIADKAFESILKAIYNSPAS